ncbi:MAG TPA: HAD-IC family P-type ATPase [Acidimicrobiales bacterium]|nr:HAD-IC family P-type ATPase [Acidimicrobiales bacterium]
MTDSVEVVPAAAPTGLTEAEVAERRAQGLVNVTSGSTKRTVAGIVRANVLTRFNAILGTLLVVVLAIGDYRDALFGIVLVSNALIGIVQELRAKRTLDRLELVAAPRATVVRDGAPREVAVTDVVRDDLVEAHAGDQIVVDGVVVASDNLEVDESLLTGEADPIHKAPGDRVLSGSFVVAGSGRYQATAVGDDAYAARLAAEAKQFVLARSELREGTDRILRVLTWVLIPTAGLLVASQLNSNASFVDAVSGSVAGIAASIPEGLVLLTSMAFAVGVIRLGRRQALVQELAAVEVLARVDVVCVDKTGTLTAGGLSAGALHLVDDLLTEADVRAGIASLVAAEPRPNASLAALGELGAGTPWPATAAVPFSSARKWSAASFDGAGTWVLGAPDVLLPEGDPVRARAEELAAAGSRVLLIARTAAPLEGEALPDGRRAAALCCLEEQVRPEAPDTIAWFKRQGVDVKVISGDHPVTVANIADQVGVEGADAPIDARELPEDQGELAQLLEERSVFGRVQPHQKRAMVGALQSRGHVVAMTGDGVNDVLALKDADIGVSMGSGSGATRSVAQLVLLDDSFASLPAVVGEGRRVIANIERVANLFVTKSVYALLLSIAIGVAQLPFPFYPRHLTIISSLTIGIPGFFLALAPNERRAYPGFVGRVVRFAVPAGIVAAVATFSGYYLARTEPGISLTGERTTAVIVLFLVAAWVLMILARPLTKARVAMLTALGLAFVAAMSIPFTRDFFELRIPPVIVVFAAIGIAAIAIGVLEAGWQIVEWRRRKQSVTQRSDPA